MGIGIIILAIVLGIAAVLGIVYLIKELRD